MTLLERYGWRGAVEPGIARVTSAHGDYYRIVCNESAEPILARKKKSAFARRVRQEGGEGPFRRVERVEEGDERLTPITGDFVTIRHNEQGEHSS